MRLDHPIARRILRALWVFVISCGALAQTSTAGTDLDAAAAMVKDLHLGDNVQNLVLAAASKTETFNMLRAKAGPSKGPALFLKYLSIARQKYQAQWDANLSQAYSEHFSAKEMISLDKDKGASPYFSAFKERQQDVGVSMQRLSSDLLTKITSEVLTGAYSEATAAK